MNPWIKFGYSLISIILFLEVGFFIFIFRYGTLRCFAKRLISLIFALLFSAGSLTEIMYSVSEICSIFSSPEWGLTFTWRII